MSTFNALVLAGGTWQVPLIKFLQKKGYKVTVADPYLDSAGVIIADNHMQVDVRDANKILTIVKENFLDFDFIISDQSDVAIQTLAFLNKELGKPGVLPEVAELFTNKYRMRNFANSLKIPVPKFIQCKSESDVTKFHKSLNGRSIIIKPADSQSSRGIFKVNNFNIINIPQFLNECFKNTQLQYVICEECIEGIEMTAEGFSAGSQHRTLAISKKKHFRFGIASDLIYPADLEIKVLQKLREYNDHYVNKSELQFGITHAEYMYDPLTEEVYLIEIACRGGGTLISSDIIPWVSNIDVYELLFRNLIGETTDLNKLQFETRSAVLHFFEFENGTVNSIEGIDEILSMPETLRFQLDFKVGDILRSATDDRSRQGFIILLAQNPDQLYKELEVVQNTLKVNLN